MGLVVVKNFSTQSTEQIIYDMGNLAAAVSGWRPYQTNEDFLGVDQ